MFLLEFIKGCFVDGEKVTFVSISGGKVSFWTDSEPKEQYDVDKDLAENFCNDLQAMNNNRVNMRVHIGKIKEK